MKRIIYISILLTLSVLHIRAQTRIGYTDVEFIMRYMPEVAQVEKDVKNQEIKLNNAIDIQQKSLEKRQYEYTQRRENKQFTAETQAAAERELTVLHQDWETALNTLPEKLNQFRMARLEPVRNKIQAAVNSVAREGGFTFILNNSAGDGIPWILYNVEQSDVTIAICKKLGIDTRVMEMKDR